MRNCKSFKYNIKKGKKVYKPKACEIKVEEFANIKGNISQVGNKIGAAYIDLSRFINKGLKTITYPLDQHNRIFL